MNMKAYQVDAYISPNEWPVYTDMWNIYHSAEDRFNRYHKTGYATATLVGWNLEKGYSPYMRIGNSIRVKRVTGCVTLANTWYNIWKYEPNLDFVGSYERLFRVSVVLCTSVNFQDPRYAGEGSWVAGLTSSNYVGQDDAVRGIAYRSNLHAKLFKGLYTDYYTPFGPTWDNVDIKEPADFGNPINIHTPEDYIILHDEYVTLKPDGRTVSTYRDIDGPDNYRATVRVPYDIATDFTMTFKDNNKTMRYPQSGIQDNMIMVVVSTNYCEAGEPGGASQTQQPYMVLQAQVEAGRHYWSNSTRLVYEE